MDIKLSKIFGTIWCVLVFSTAHFRKLKGFPEEIGECLLGMVVAFFSLCRKKECLLCQIWIVKKKKMGKVLPFALTQQQSA